MVEESSEYDETVPKNIAKWAKILQTQMRSHTSDAFDPIYVISFLSSFKFACAVSRIHGGAVMRFFPIFMKISSAAALNARLRLKPTSLSNAPMAKK